MRHWSDNAIFYHIYPLGLCGAPKDNDYSKLPVPGLEIIDQWIDHMKNLGVNAIYLGPLFESVSHGYDTTDYFQVDRRLGTDETLINLVQNLHRNGFRVILDGVFNHVGRDFRAFKDLQLNKQNSKYINWFMKINFNQRSPLGDDFSYEGWEGHYNLVKLNLLNPEVRKHIFDAVGEWIQKFDIDGLRLDVAYCLEPFFLKELRNFCQNLKEDFWLMGEMIHGDYTKQVNQKMLHSGTNYECYKGLFSSHNDKNYFEIAYSLNRLFGDQGVYKNLRLYSFADNHDVDRIADKLNQKEHLFPLYCLLFTMPGIPALYYGSEWGILGKKSKHSDEALRPQLNLNELNTRLPNQDLINTIKKLIQIRKKIPALRYGNYKQLHVNNQQLVFSRQSGSETIITAINSSDKHVSLDLELNSQGQSLIDLFNDGDSFNIQKNKSKIELYPNWARIMKIN